MLGASQHRREVWWGRGKERRQTRDVHAHFTHMILYSTASIEASLDYYTNKNVVLRPARMIYREGHTPLVLNYIGLHHSMHVHFSKMHLIRTK